MSKERRIPNFKCPKCGKEFEITVYESINTSLNPELREKVLDGSIFNFKCPHCGEVHNLPYPFLYHDMKNQTMIYQNDYADLMDIYENQIKTMSSEDNPLNMFKEMIDEVKYIGAPSYIDLITAIVCEENNLNLKVAWLVIYSVALDFVSNQTDEDYQSTNRIGLRYDEKGEMEICMGAGKKNPKVFTNRFPMKMYKEYEEKYAKALEHTYDFIFDEDAAEKFLNEYEADLPKYNKTTKLALLSSPNGNLLRYPVFVPKFSKAKKGDIVVVNYDGDMHFGKIANILEFSNKALPLKAEKLGYIQYIDYDYFPKAKYDIKIKLDNKNILEQFSKYIENERKYKFFPFEDLYASKVIIGFSYNVKFDVKELLKEDDKDQIEGKPDIKIDTTDVKGHRLLNVYLSKEDSDASGNDIEKIVVDFRDVLKFIKSNPDYFEGIFFNPKTSKENVFMNHYMINKTYIDTLMGLKDNMCKLLYKFSKEEIEYMSMDEYGDTLNMIKRFYPADKSPKDVAIELNMPEDNVHKLLEYGYEKMQKVVICNYENVD